MATKWCHQVILPYATMTDMSIKKKEGKGKCNFSNQDEVGGTNDSTSLEE